MKAAEIRVGLGSCGVASGGEAVRDALLAEAARAGAAGIVKTAGCNGMCHCEPLVEAVGEDGQSILYAHVTAETARAIARLHLRPKGLARRAWWAAQAAAASLGGGWLS